MNNDKYIVYKHTSPSNKVYIGITKQNPEKRWQNGYGYKRNNYFWRAIQKYGWNNFKHEILFDGLTKEIAEQKERELVSYYNSADYKYGYNLDNGGKCIGSFSEAHKQKISRALIGRPKPKLCGENHPFYGKHLSEETKKRISDSKRGKSGLPMSDQHKKQISEINKKPVLQYDINGKFIKEWDGAISASKEIGLSRANITSCCKNKRKTCGGFIWRYKNDELKYDDIDNYKPFYYQCKPIYQYSIDGKFIKKYKSIKSAVVENGFNIKSGTSNIHYCCSGKTKSAYGYVWKYAEDVSNISEAIQ